MKKFLCKTNLLTSLELPCFKILVNDGKKENICQGGRRIDHISLKLD